MQFSTIDQSATMPLEAYNPAKVIAAVNALQPLGKEQALAQIESYLRRRKIKTATTGLFWVLRVLFELPSSQAYPPVLIGTPVIPAPADPRTLPRFPIVLVQDIPFLAVTGYILGGKAEPIENHIKFYREYGEVLEKLLAPPASPDRIEQDFLRLWKAAYGDAYAAQALETIKAQISRLSK